MTDKLLIDTGPSDRGIHRQETFRRCPFLFAAKYKLRLGHLMGNREALIRGTMGHIGLAHYYARKQAEQRGTDPEVFFAPMDAIAEKVRRLPDQEGAAAAEIARRWLTPVQVAIEAYMTWYAQENLEVLHVEHPVEMQFGPTPDTRMTQRFDLVVRDSSQRVWVWDHKCVGRIDRKSTARYTLCGQFLEMVWQARNIWGDDFGGLRINVVQVSNPPDPKFHRVSPDPAPAALADFPQSVVDTEGLIAQLERARPDPWMWGPRAYSEVVCMTPYGPCDAQELCRWGKAGLADMENRHE